MKIDDNGVVREMTDEEVKRYFPEGKTENEHETEEI